MTYFNTIGKKNPFSLAYAEFGKDAVQQILVDITTGYGVHLIDRGFDFFRDKFRGSIFIHKAAGALQIFPGGL